MKKVLLGAAFLLYIALFGCATWAVFRPGALRTALYSWPVAIGVWAYIGLWQFLLLSRRSSLFTSEKWGRAAALASSILFLAVLVGALALPR